MHVQDTFCWGLALVLFGLALSCVGPDLAMLVLLGGSRPDLMCLPTTVQGRFEFQSTISDRSLRSIHASVMFFSTVFMENADFRVRTQTEAFLKF